jgi:CheY-like chemotaxis protein
MSSAPIFSAILVAEDDPSDLFLFERALAAAGCTERPLVFGNGAELIEHLRLICHEADARARPRLLFLDLHIPQVDGGGVIAWVKRQKELAGLRIVVASGSGDSSDARRAESLGADVVVTKPVSDALLRAELRRLGEPPRVDHVASPAQSTESS